jgi:Ca2+-binding RTX toxin-like protein
MITVKATRQSQPGAQTTREDFAVDESDRRRWVPVAFLLFLVGCAAYLKSFMPAGIAAPHEIEPPQASKDEDEASVQADTTGSIGAKHAEQEDVTGSVGDEKSAEATPEPAEGGAVRSGLWAEANPFPSNASTPIDFRGMLQPALLKIDNKPTGDPVRAGNDDRPMSSGSPTGGGGAGGGGGGGDQADNSRDNGPARPTGTPNGSGMSGSPGGAGPATPGGPGTTPNDNEPIRNRAPRVSGPVYLPNVVGCDAMLVSVLVLLAGASDPDGDPLRVASLASSSGTLTPTDNGEWQFTRDQGMLGDVTLSYTISDGQQTIQQVAHFTVVEAPPIIGTTGDDNLLGTHCADTIDGAAGNDNIDAREGNDIVFGGDGDDHIIAGSGSDIVYAGAGNDIVFAGSGNDIVFGGFGNDRLFGEDGDDTLDGGPGDDGLDGGPGNDRLVGGPGDDLLEGGPGNDVLADGPGSDTARGGDGDDYFVAAADAAADRYAGDVGHDTLDYSASVRPVSIDLDLGTAEGEEIGNDSIESVEAVITGIGNDRIVAGRQATSIDSGSGDDSIDDGPSADRIDTGPGNDRVFAAMDQADDSYCGGDGEDRLDYSRATLTVTVNLAAGTAQGEEIGRDLLSGFEEIIGGSGGDYFIGSGPVVLTGGGGNDTFEFQRSDSDHQPDLVRKITDFTVGDRIIAATYEIYYRDEDDAADELSDLFDEVYLADGSDNRPVRFRFEEKDDGEMTTIEIHDRPDNDQEFYAIQLNGHHSLQFTVAIT